MVILALKKKKRGHAPRIEFNYGLLSTEQDISSAVTVQELTQKLNSSHSMVHTHQSNSLKTLKMENEFLMI